MTLVELLVATALAALLVLGLVSISSATSAASKLQRNQAEIYDNARFAMTVLARAIREAGFSPEPWNDEISREAFTAETTDGGPASSDRLALRTWSDRNCFDNRNPDVGADGQPLFYIRESVFDVTANMNLAHRCQYGPAAGEMTTQIARQGMVRGIESFQVLYGEDGDRDGHVDRWVTAGEWGEPGQVLGLRIGLLVASEDAVADDMAHEFAVLDVDVTTPPDGRLRRVFSLAAAIRGRTP